MTNVAHQTILLLSSGERVFLNHVTNRVSEGLASRSTLLSLRRSLARWVDTIAIIAM